MPHRSSLSFARPFHQLIGFLCCSCRRLAVGCFTAGSQTVPFDWLACLHFGPSAFVCGKLYVEFKHSFFMCLNVYVCICCENWIQHRTSVISQSSVIFSAPASASPPSSSICTLATSHFDSFCQSFECLCNSASDTSKGRQAIILSLWVLRGTLGHLRHLI